jgi:lysozyme family protein
MRFSSISSSFVNEKEKGYADHLEDTGQATDNVITEEAPSEAWLRSEKRIVRKLEMTLLPTVWTLYLFK